MELEVDEVVGPKGKHDPDRVAVRHGHEAGSMTLGGRRVAVRRPRMRTAADERELPVESYENFADRDPLTRAVMDRMLAGVSTRKFARVGEPVGGEVEQASTSTAKTAVSDMFIERTRTALGELMSRRLDDVRLAVMMLDGLEIADRTHVVALGITTDDASVRRSVGDVADHARSAAGEDLFADRVGLAVAVHDNGLCARVPILGGFRCEQERLRHRAGRHTGHVGGGDVIQGRVTVVIGVRDRDTDAATLRARRGARRRRKRKQPDRDRRGHRSQKDNPHSRAC